MENLLLNDEQRGYQPMLAYYIGLNEALVLQQLHYMVCKADEGSKRSGMVVDGVRWIRMTQEEWVDDFPFFDVGQIKKIIKNLQDDGLIIGKAIEGKGRSKWYTPVYETIRNLDSPVARLQKRQAKRKKAAKFSVKKRDDYVKASEQSVPIVGGDGTKCSNILEQNVPTIGTKCSTSEESSENSPKDKSLSNDKDSGKPLKPKTIVMNKFLELTDFELPTDRNPAGFWWHNINQILKIAKDDPDFACEVITETIRQMRIERLRISSPKSLVNIARDVAVELKGRPVTPGWDANPSPPQPPTAPDYRAALRPYCPQLSHLLDQADISRSNGHWELRAPPGVVGHLQRPGNMRQLQAGLLAIDGVDKVEFSEV